MNIREQYTIHGVDRFYANYADEYVNPHHRQIACLLTRQIRDFDRSTRFLDLCCGSGIVTEILQSKQFENIDGCDPFLYRQYESNTNRKCFTYNFVDISQGCLTNDYDVVVCSFALHLCPTSLLPQLTYQLSRIAPKLIVISPSKYPIFNTFCWQESCHKTYNRVHLRQFNRIGS